MEVRTALQCILCLFYTVLMISLDVPDFLFFSRATLFSGLLSHHQIRHIDMDNLCNFGEFCNERLRDSHTLMPVEERLAEIGGVIVGSLAAGMKARPLSKEEYLKEIRSNITNKTEEGKTKRLVVYDVFDKYQAWKARHGRYDIDDVVLILLKVPHLKQIFDSGKLQITLSLCPLVYD